MAYKLAGKSIIPSSNPYRTLGSYGGKPGVYAKSTLTGQYFFIELPGVSNSDTETGVIQVTSHSHNDNITVVLYVVSEEAGMRLGAFSYSYPSSIDGVPAPEPIYDDEGNLIGDLGVVTATVVNFDKPIKEILSKYTETTGNYMVDFRECEGGVYLMARTVDETRKAAPITLHYDPDVDLVVTKATRQDGQLRYNNNPNDTLQHAIHGGVFLQDPIQIDTPHPYLKTGI